MSDQEKVKHLILDTIVLLCKNSLNYRSNVAIQGLIGVTVDDKDIFLVHIDKHFAPDPLIISNDLYFDNNENCFKNIHKNKPAYNTKTTTTTVTEKVSRNKSHSKALLKRQQQQRQQPNKSTFATNITSTNNNNNEGHHVSRNKSKRKRTKNNNNNNNNNLSLPVNDDDDDKIIETNNNNNNNNNSSSEQLLLRYIKNIAAKSMETTTTTNFEVASSENYQSISKKKKNTEIIQEKKMNFTMFRDDDDIDESLYNNNDYYIVAGCSNQKELSSGSNCLLSNIDLTVEVKKEKDPMNNIYSNNNNNNLDHLLAEDGTSGNVLLSPAVNLTVQIKDENLSVVSPPPLPLTTDIIKSSDDHRLLLNEKGYYGDNINSLSTSDNDFNSLTKNNVLRFSDSEMNESYSFDKSLPFNGSYYDFNNSETNCQNNSSCSLSNMASLINSPHFSTYLNRKINLDRKNKRPCVGIQSGKPRLFYNTDQKNCLEAEYLRERFLSNETRRSLAERLGLTQYQVSIWFQNRRAKDKKIHRR